MGVKGLFKFVIRRLFEVVIVVGVIIFLPNLPPYAKFSKSISLPPTRPLEGKLAVNERLKDVEIWHKGDLVGPESFADFNGELYTSIIGGDIVKLVGNEIRPVVKTGKPCKGYYEEQICGRPLGLQFNENGDLFVADAYYGILKVNVKTGQKQTIIDPDQEIGGEKPKLFNSIALAKNGDIFWTDSSTDFELHDGVFTMLADPSGRLVHYDAKSKTNKILIDKIHFANGVLLSDDEEFVLVGETFANRIHRYYLKGPKKGTSDIFIDRLPGLVDNLKSDGQGGVFVSLVKADNDEHPLVTRVLLPFPLLRKFVARLFGITQLGFETLNKYFPNEFAQKAVHHIGHFTSMPSIFESPRTTIIHLSKSGEILDNLSTINKNLINICEVHIFKNDLYFATPFGDYIGRIPLSKVGWEHLNREGRNKRDVPVVEPKVETASTAKTTTAKPATQRTTPTPVKQSTSPPPVKQAPPPPKQQTTPPPKQQTTQPPKQQTTQPPKQQTNPPPKQTTQSPKQQTTQPPKQQTAPPPKQQTPPPPKQQTSPPPPPKQQTPPPPKQQTPPPPPPKQPPPQKQSPPPNNQGQTTPPPKQQTAAPSKPQTVTQEYATRTVPVKDKANGVPVKDSTKSRS